MSRYLSDKEMSDLLGIDYLEQPEEDNIVKEDKDPNAGKTLYCSLCSVGSNKRKIKKGEKYWSMGPFILCKECKEYCHG